MVPSSVTDRNCQPLGPFLSPCPQPALWTPKCALSAARLGPHVPSSFRRLVPSWAPSPGPPKAAAPLSLGSFRRPEWGVCARPARADKKPQGGGKLTICCTRILKRPLPRDFVRVSPPSPHARAGKARWSGNSQGSRETRRRPNVPGALAKGCISAPVIRRSFQA